MENFKKYIVAFLLIISSAVMFTACGFTPLKSAPDINDAVIGNGGLAVQKGDYIYFANGYTKQEDVTSAKQNEFNKVNYSALYRVKLVDGKVKYLGNDPYVVETAELVAPRIAGTENTGIYIFGDKIYYTSPNTEKDRSGKFRSDLLDFYEASLTGANSKRIYTTPSFNENAVYSMIKIGNDVFINFYDGTENLYTINVKTKAVKKIATGVTGVYFPKQSDLANNNTLSVEDIYTYVYYTRSRTESESGSGNILARAKVGSNNENIIKNKLNETYSVKGVVGSNVYFTKTSELDSSESLYSANYVSGGNQKLLISTTFSQIYIVSHNSYDYDGLLVVGESQMAYLNTSNTVQTIASGTVTILAYHKGIIIYTKDDGKIYHNRISTLNEVCLTAEEGLTLSQVTAKGVDFDGRMLYLFREYTSENDTIANYLNYIDTLVLGEEGIHEAKFIGKFLIDDYPKEEDAD